MIIDCCADLHGNYPTLDGGDLLIVAGDLTASDKYLDYLHCLDWILGQPYKKKVLIAGNHDNYLRDHCSSEWEKGKSQQIAGIDYLCDSGTEIQWNEPTLTKDGLKYAPSNYSYANKKLKIWGSPWTLTFPGINPKCTAFTGDEGLLAEKFALIPDDIDILVTHGPSFGNLDITKRGESVGSISLWMKILEVRPKMHIFGHIHESYGDATHYNGIRLINCSHVNEHYEPVNKPIRIIL